jgi:hypothetical protein
MTHETLERPEHLRTPRGIAMLYVAVLGPPIVWALGLNAQYGLVRVACATESNLPMHAVSVVTLLLALGCGLVAWRAWGEAGRQWPGEGGGTLPRSRFMAVMGLFSSALFSLAILAQWVASFVLHPCMGI